ncbi:MAG: transglutaminase family protein [Alphaproteobacteria bacterium]|nr:transglutaminase family protein [Alphaproteobacteria bacterium]
MRIKIGYDIAFECPAETAMILMLSIHPSRDRDLETPTTMYFDPQIPAREYTDRFGNICTRVVAPAGILRMHSEAIIRDSGLPDAVVPDAPQPPVDQLPDDTLEYLLASRYCEVDRLSDLAWSLFSSVAPGWTRVQAICDYVHERLTFSYADARSTRTAYEGHEECLAVCRDFAHLAITFCRCMNIPARYCTGYLGDIGIPPVPDPMDFSAWFEVYLGDRWYTFDARHNIPRIGRILMARGRDAADVALSTSFGPNRLANFQVVTDELPQ